jgi:lipopolysaccharide biosynthesis glycosyltransferase/glycosyltransferase involved in cell wall biosynthesis
MDIIFASDNNYAPHLGVHIRSIAETTPGPINIHVLEKSISDECKSSIWECVRDFPVSVSYYGVPFEHEIGAKTPDYINEVAMFRLLAPSVLAHVDRAIYLDVDALVATSLQELWDTPLEGNLIALVESPWRKYDKYKLEIGLTAVDPYFNSGTMLIDLAGMRAAGTEDEFIKCFLKDRETIEFPDQDVINIVLKGKIKPLHPRWSVVRAVYDHNGKGTKTYGAKEIAEAKQNPGVIQYSGKTKPWHHNCRHPLGYMYSEVRQRTPWALPEDVYGRVLSNRPDISVVMATRNGENTLAGAIESILAQTHTNFEFIIIDDGSTDSTPSILREAAERDPRIRIVTNDTTRGLPYSLNRGLDAAAGDFIARMDDDDISEPNRFEEQIRYMWDNPHTHVCGTNVTVIRPFWHEPKEYTPGPPEMDKDIKVAMISRPGIIHPTVMMRAAYLRAKNARYDETFLKAQDFELWTRLAFQHQARFHNIQTPLFQYRIRNTDPREVRSAQENAAYKIVTRTARMLGIEDEKQVDLHARWALKKLNQAEAKRRYREVARHVRTVLLANKEKMLFDQGTLEATLLSPYKKDFQNFHKEGAAGIKRFEEFPLKSFLRIPPAQLKKYKKQARRTETLRKLLSAPGIGILLRFVIAFRYPNAMFGKVSI